MGRHGCCKQRGNHSGIESASPKEVDMVVHESVGREVVKGAGLFVGHVAAIVVGVFIYLAVALATIGSLGARGLALANAIQNSAHALVLLRHGAERRMPGGGAESAAHPIA